MQVDEIAPWNAGERRQFREKLVRWYSRHARDLPWRQTKDPYAIWVSEVMLQQTQVATVVPYYDRFLKRFPDIGALARAQLRTVLRYWEGLGYYRRARQLHSAARILVRDFNGTFPTNEQDVRALPGIGRYTAGAILSLASDYRLPILEANTTRLLCRLLALHDDPTTTAAQRRLWEMAESLLPKCDIGRVNQALMELGSQICRPGVPLCHLCPVSRHCAACQRGLQDQLPRKSPARVAERVTEAAVVIRRRQQVLLRQCQPDERWAGLWDFPRFRMTNSRPLRLTDELTTHVSRWLGANVVVEKELARLRHSVTRFDITLHCFAATVAGRYRHNPAHSRWVATDDMHQYPLNVTARRLSQLLGSRRPSANGRGV